MIIADADLLALCAFQEANLEPDDGMAAVVRVIKNRMAVKFQSDGTVSGTVFHGNGVGFSWAAFEEIDGHYVRVADGPAAIQARAEKLLFQAQRYAAAWRRAQRISAAVMVGSYVDQTPRPANQHDGYGALTDDTLLYDNLALATPPWATPDKFVARIMHHSFFRP